MAPKSTMTRNIVLPFLGFLLALQSLPFAHGDLSAPFISAFGTSTTGSLVLTEYVDPYSQWSPERDAYATPNTARLWAPSFAGITDYTREVDSVVEVAFTGGMDYMLRYSNGSVEWVVSTGIGTSGTTQTWLPSQYTGLTSGDTHYCVLSLAGVASCMTATSVLPTQIPPASAFFDASFGRFTQISAAARRTCGLFVNGTMACGGFGYNAAMSKVHLTVTQFSSIAAFSTSSVLAIGIRASDGAIVNVGIDSSEVITESVVWAAPTPNESPFRYPVPCHEITTFYYCGLRMNGSVSCNAGNAPVPDGWRTTSQPMSQFILTATGGLGVTSPQHALIAFEDPTSGFNPAYWGRWEVYQPMKLWVIDPVLGNDTRCSPLDYSKATTALVAQTLANPCRTIGYALSNTVEYNTWIYLRPGNYYEGGLQIPLSNMTIIDRLPRAPPGVNYPAAYQNNSQPNLNPSLSETLLANLYCQHMDYCFQVEDQVDALWIEGIQFHDVNLFAVQQDSQRSMLRRVHALGTQGGLMKMSGGIVRMNWVRVEHALPIPTAANYDPSWGLVQLEDNFEVTISDSLFAHNRMEGDYEARGTVITIRNFITSAFRPPTNILRCSFVNNTRVNYFPVSVPSFPDRFPRCLSGVVINLNGTNSLLHVEQSTFMDNRVEGSASCGLAINVAHQVWDALNGISLEIVSSSFLRNIALLPTNTYAAGMRGVVSVQCGTDIFGAVSPLVEGTYVSINNTLFDSNSVPFGTATFFGVHQLNVQHSTFTNNSYASSYVGTLVTRAAAGSYAISDPYPVQLISNTFVGNNAPQADLETWMNVLVLNNTFTANALPDGETCQAGGLSAVGIFTTAEIQVTACNFFGLHCPVAGAMYMSNLQLTMSNTTFMQNTADYSAGAAFFQTMQVTATDTSFFRNAVIPPPASQQNQDSKTSFFEGGAIVFISGSLALTTCTFDGNRVVPRGDDLNLCQELYDYGSSTTYDYRAGSISIREATLKVTYCAFSNGVSCSAGDIYSFGQSALITGTTFTKSLAWTSAAVIVSSTEAVTMFGSTFTDTTAVYSAGALAFSGLNHIAIEGCIFINCVSQKGDGAAIWIGNVVPLLRTDIVSNQVMNCSAPLGGGLLTFFSATTGGSTRDVTPFIDSDSNTIISFDNATVQYGPQFATDPFSISLSMNSLTMYAGQSFNDNPNPFNISVHAIDGFNQTVRGDRGLVVIAEIIVDSSRTMSFQPVLYGTILRSMAGSDGGAYFTDLKFGADPGTYSLRFSVVSVRSIPPVILPVTILPGCSAGTYFDVKQHVCTVCANSILVYDKATNECSPCPATRVPRGSSSCALCDLGKTNSGGASCRPCPSNTYSPVPGAACQSCQQNGQEGLDCAQGDLAQVSVGWFAYSVIDDSGQPTIQTVQCPENFCSGGLVQQIWNDTATEFINGTSMTVVPVFASAVTRFDQQCAYPRLATEDNYLCGQCSAGLLPWGDKCSKCDRTNGGLVFLLLVITFVLVGFLLRGSLSSAQAGHSAIVLYFIQTAMLEVGSTSHFVSWLNIALLSPSSFSDCIAPVTPYQQSQLQILMPLFLLAELLVICMIHFALFSFRNNNGVSRSRIIIHPSANLLERWKNRSLNFIDHFSIDAYISASFSILLFSYTQVTVSCFSFLACVSVGDKVSVVFTSPTMVCNSSEYRSHLVLVVIAMVLYVAGLPLAIGMFLYSRQSMIKQAHDLIVAQAQRENVPMELEEIGDISAPSSPAGGAVAPSVDSSKPSNAAAVTFLRRYSPLFSMYSPGAFLWIILVLARRVVFVSISVSLVRKPAMKFLGYSLAHLTSLLMQLWARPFQVDFYNYAEVVSHLLLILLSQSLTAVLPPYTNASQIYLFCLIVPPVPSYALLAFTYRLRQRRAQHAALFSKYRASDASAPANLQQSPMHELQQRSLGLHDESSAAIELGSVAEPSINGVESSDRVLLVEAVQSDSTSIAAQHDSETL